MSLTLADMKSLAHLARIDMSDEELESLSHDFDSILGYVDQITAVKIPEISVKPAQVNIARADENPTESGTYSDTMLADAPESQDGFYKVPKIL